MEIIILIIYMLSLLFIFLFSLGQLHLTWHYRKAQKERTSGNSELETFPFVTVQLPVYNERYVAARLIDSICNLDYPADCLEIQVLDDSTDETVQIIRERIEFWQERGIPIVHVQRADRTGFKAGALEYGLGMAKGEFIAIFDADFLPQADFLKTSLASFTERTGVVQSRWGHINENYSLLTRLQAFGLDAHFTVEQSGRSHAGSFINFNGTAGIWRKACIIDAGGWSADTLTEDLDLSYRAQLNGWEFHYLEYNVAPAELPVIMPAIKSQQYRWNKGAAETARKNLGKVLRSPMSLTSKFHAFFHLLNSSVFVALLLAGLVSIPVIFIRESHPELNILFHVGGIFLIGFFSIAYFYWTAIKSLHPERSAGYFFLNFFPFLIVSMGLSLHNGMAVLEGLFGRKTPFLRTPKFNILNSTDSWKNNRYVKRGFSWRTVAEGFLTLYFGFGLLSGFRAGDPGLMLFHLMLMLGFGFVFYQSVKSIHGGTSISS
ncbi:glycosyltransferase [Fulvivirga sp. 1062]|uniref:Glycosyltransferase n=2 Tax=Fulvivirga sedimenti TaxID=2879465 RepID=A0A9X1HU88_9BACT|nr:glycosyltransferase [Fulvivirga sedimenti]MCA6078051.1 glycosyltransferase [Fulvivirga sedimenti]